MTRTERFHRLFLSALTALALAGAIVVGADKASEGKDKKPATTQPSTQPTTQQASGKPVNKFCAVNSDDPVDPSAGTVTYKGKVIGFCCEDCLPKFKKDPEKYMKDLK